MIGKTDEQLLALLKTGDRDAVDELYRRYAKKLHIFFSRVMKISSPEDLVHDVFVRVIEKAHQFDPRKASFRTWAFRIAHNHSINLFRRERLVKFSSLEDRIGSEGAGSELRLGDVLEDPTCRVDESGLALSVRQCIDELKEDTEKRVFVLYHLLGRNFQEIAGVFRKSVSGVRKYVIAAEEKVRRCLERKGIDSVP